MTRRALIAMAAAGAVCGAAALRISDAEVAQPFVGTIHVSPGLDGDSLHLERPDGSLTIELRLADFDAPELAHPGLRIAEQPGARASRQAMIDLAGSQTLTCTSTGQSSHLRAVVRCSLPGVPDVAAWMAAHGWGYASSAGRDCRLEPLVEQAQHEKLGIFGIVPATKRAFPWVWRHHSLGGQTCPGERS